MPGELVSTYTMPFSANTLGGETQHSQSPVVALHKPLPPKTHSKGTFTSTWYNLTPLATEKG
jgi:hypothetical protein